MFCLCLRVCACVLVVVSRDGREPAVLRRVQRRGVARRGSLSARLHLSAVHHV